GGGVAMRRLAYWLSLAMIFTIPWEGAFHLPGLGTVATVMGLVTGAFWIGTVILTGHVRAPTNAFLFVLMVFTSWVVLSVYWSPDPTESMGSVLRWLQSLVFVLILWDLFPTRARLLVGMQAYVLGACVAIGGAIVNYLGSRAFYTNMDRYSLGDTNPDGYGFIVALGVPIACYLIASRELPPLFRFVNLAYLPLAFVGIALSGTRTASIGAAVGLLYGLAALTRLRLVARVAVVASLSGALFFLLPILQPLASFQRLGTTGTEVTEGDLNGRLSQWEQGFRAFTEHPVLGVGTNMYRSVNTLDKVAHNSYLSVLVELGLVGFALFATILGLVVSAIWTLPRWDRRFWITVFVVWAIGASTLTWEHRKTTWLFLTFAWAAAAIRARAPVRDRIVLPETAPQLGGSRRPLPSVAGGSR
ncbi:MAG TPA: O-antigen ligase family protein, partial [Actinomycetota bacterium]|nr:O-antigen ligase family protein [Actinomycetota bacterium]